MSDTTPTDPARPSSHSAIRWLLILLLGLLLIAGLLRIYSDPGDGEHATVGKTLPLSGVVALGGGATSFSPAELKDKVVLVNFWATWCGPCRMELPQIEKVSKEFSDRPDFMLLPIATDQELLDTLQFKAEELMQRLGIELPLYADPTGAAFEAFLNAGGQNGIPVTIVLDRRGRIQAVWQGYHHKLPNKLRTTIQQLLDSPS